MTYRVPFLHYAGEIGVQSPEMDKVHERLQLVHDFMRERNYTYNVKTFLRNGIAAHFTRFTSGKPAMPSGIVWYADMPDLTEATFFKLWINGEMDSEEAQMLGNLPDLEELRKKS